MLQRLVKITWLWLGGGVVEGLSRGLIWCTAVELAWMNWGPRTLRYSKIWPRFMYSRSPLELIKSAELSLYSVQHHAVAVLGGRNRGIAPHTLLTSALHGNKLVCSTPRGKAPSIDWLGGCEGPRATRDAFDRRQITEPLPRIEQIFFICLARIVVTAFTIDLHHVNNLTEIKLWSHF